MAAKDLIQVCIVRADDVRHHDFRDDHDSPSDEAFEMTAKQYGLVMSLDEYQDYINGTSFREDDRIRFTLKIA